MKVLYLLVIETDDEATNIHNISLNESNILESFNKLIEKYINSNYILIERQDYYVILEGDDLAQTIIFIVTHYEDEKYFKGE